MIRKSCNISSLSEICALVMGTDIFPIKPETGFVETSCMLIRLLAKTLGLTNIIIVSAYPIPPNLRTHPPGNSAL